MIATHPTMTVPLRTDEYGKIRVGNTRVLLEIVIRAYLSGETPESIVDSYSTLQTADVYAVIAYYLNHRAEIDTYVRQADERVAQILREIEANATPEAKALRTRLRAVREQKKQSK